MEYVLCMLLYFSFILITYSVYVSEIAGRLIHLIKVMNTVFLCTEEVVRHFSDFSGRHVVLKILDARGVKIPFCEIGRKDSHAIINDLES